MPPVCSCVCPPKLPTQDIPSHCINSDFKVLLQGHFPKQSGLTDQQVQTGGTFLARDMLLPGYSSNSQPGSEAEERGTGLAAPLLTPPRCAAEPGFEASTARGNGHVWWVPGGSGARGFSRRLMTAPRAGAGACPAPQQRCEVLGGHRPGPRPQVAHGGEGRGDCPPTPGGGVLTTAPPPAPPCTGPFCAASAMAAPSREPAGDTRSRPQRQRLPRRQGALPAPPRPGLSLAPGSAGARTRQADTGRGQAAGAADRAAPGSTRMLCVTSDHARGTLGSEGRSSAQPSPPFNSALPRPAPPRPEEDEVSSCGGTSHRAPCPGDALAPDVITSPPR